MILLAAIVLPLLLGLLLPLLPLKGAGRKAYLLISTLLPSALVALALLSPDVGRLDLMHLSERLVVALKLDGVGKVFAGLVALLWPITTLYALEYMQDVKKQDSFYAFFLMSYGLTLGIAMSANLLTLYIFYEMMSLSTLPLVMQGGSPKAMAAGIKYLYYSLGGAAFAFIGLVYLVYFGGNTEFGLGGLFQHVGAPHVGQLRLGYLLCFLGFAVKAAVFPLHAWLPTASVAPTPVTALLHAVAVVKSGVFAIIRVTYFSFGAWVLQGSYAQHIPLALCVFTIVFGCSMALREKHLKRRLVYSTVSNLSYILFGVLLLTPAGLTAGLMHMVFHAIMKITLFMVAGTFLLKADVDYISDLRGISRQMPYSSAIFMLCSVAMTGIPPLMGFLSKWSLGLAAVNAGGPYALAGLVALMISAILTGIYLIVPALATYTAKRPANSPDVQPTGLPIKLSLGLLSLMLLAISFYSQPLIDYLARAASGLG